MQVTMSCQPSYSVATCVLDYGESLLCERDAMVTMSAGFDIGGSTGGGMARAGLRKALGGENFVLGRYTARVQGANLSVAPKMPGDIAHLRVSPNDPGLLLQQGSFLACSEGVKVDISYGGLKQVLVKEGITLLNVSGSGDLLIASYGAMMQTFLDADDELVVDTGHLVGHSATVKVSVGLLGGASASALTGEGLVSTLRGPGQVLIQTRAEQSLRSWLFPERAHDRRR